MSKSEIASIGAFAIGVAAMMAANYLLLMMRAEIDEPQGESRADDLFTFPRLLRTFSEHKRIHPKSRLGLITLMLIVLGFGSMIALGFTSGILPGSIGRPSTA